MSHYCVYVFQDANSPSIEELLAPYDENITLDEPIVKYTRQSAIDYVRKDFAHYKETIYKEYLTDPIVYEEKYSKNKEHINYLKNEFPKRLNWTDDECYEHIKKDFKDDMIAENGDLLTTYNPKARWDWWCIGGRWCDELVLKDNSHVNDTIISKLDKEQTLCPYAFIDTNGEWHERGKMGWFGCASNEVEYDAWEKEYKQYLNSLSDDVTITIIDCHI